MDSLQDEFSWRVLGAPPEEILWFFLHIFYILVFYEHFIDEERTPLISRRTKWMFLVSAITVGVAVFLVAILGDASRIRYPYLVTGTVTMLPTLFYLIFTRAHFSHKLAPFTIYFFCYALTMEIQAVRFGLWSFADASKYAALTTLFGASFPVEEIVFG